MKGKTIKILILDAALLLLSGICLFVCKSLSAPLLSQRAAERWQGGSEMGFAQISCFMNESGKKSVEEIYEFRQTLDSKLTEASIDADNAAQLYRDAWSGFGKITVFGEHGKGDASVTAIGGDYFFFHPMTLVSGGYLSESDLMEDRVVLDRELAWLLYGGYDLAGLTVTINEKPYVIAGVVEREDDFASRDTYTGGAGVFMSYRAYSELADCGIGCYEIVLPQPVEGFAENLMSESFRIGGGEIVNNSGRYSLSSLYKVLKSFGTRSMHTNSVIYPYWENAARCIEDWGSLCLAFAIAFAVFPAVSVFVLAMIWLIRGKNFLSARIPAIVSGKIDKGRSRHYYRGTHEKRSAGAPEQKKEEAFPE